MISSELVVFANYLSQLGLVISNFLTLKVMKDVRDVQSIGIVIVMEGRGQLNKHYTKISKINGHAKSVHLLNIVISQY